ncbi:MAG: ribosome maturation factor RimM [Nocardioides sp.]|nr:ribosome maturation factor RimM [Nocardioides sp.]
MTQTPPPVVVVGRIGRAHGVRGELSVEVRTDDPALRFADGATLAVAAVRGVTLPEGCPPRVTVTATRWHQSRLLVRFAEVSDRNAAELLRGTLLTVALDPDERPEDSEEFYDHQLEGLAVRTPDGADVGRVVEVVHGAAQDLLAIRTTADREVLVPFVSALVPTVDLDAGHIVVVDQPGLLDPDRADPAVADPVMED